MRKFVMMVLGLAVLGLAIVPAAQADSLQSVLFNLNGTQYTDYSVPGMNVGAFNQGPGLGTITLTFNPGAAGSYFFDAFFDNQLSVPFFNEFGTAVGAPAAGQSWEIGDSFLSNVYPDTQANTLSNANGLPGNTSNYLNDCNAGVSCNGDGAMAMGFNFILAANQEALFTLVLSSTAPASGFYLDQTHPVDPNTPSQLDLFYSGTVQIQTPSGGQVPEPSSLLLVLSGIGVGSALLRKRLGS